MRTKSPRRTYPVTSVKLYSLDMIVWHIEMYTYIYIYTGMYAAIFVKGGGGGENLSVIIIV